MSGGAGDVPTKDTVWVLWMGALIAEEFENEDAAQHQLHHAKTHGGYRGVLYYDHDHLLRARKEFQNQQAQQNP